LNQFDCFISYKVDADDELAHNFAKYLKNDDFSVFIDKNALLPGQDWANELEKSVSQANYVLAFFTPEYVARIEEGNRDGKNFIIQELNWALNDNKLIPIAAGVTVADIEAKCVNIIPNLKGKQFINFKFRADVEFQGILNQLNKVIRTASKNKINDLSESSCTEITCQLKSEDAYLKLDMPWNTNEALEFKQLLEDKVGKESIDYVVLAKFYLLSRFNIKFSPELAYQHLHNAVRRHSKEAFFELGKLYEFGGTLYGYSDEKALEYYFNAHKLGFIPATFRLAQLLGENTENKSCPTHFLKSKYSLNQSNAYLTEITNKEHKQLITIADKYSFSLAQILANKNKEQAFNELQQLASVGYLPAIRYIGMEYMYDNGHMAQNIQKSLDFFTTGEELGDCISREQLACIHLEPAYAEIGVVQNHEFLVEIT
jgi:TPR repeat protein